MFCAHWLSSWVSGRHGTGKSVADGWAIIRVVIYTLALGLVMRFLHHALFNGPFINGFYYVFDVVLLLVFSSIGFRMRRTNRWSITTIGYTIARRHFPTRRKIDRRIFPAAQCSSEWNGFLFG